MMNQNKNKKINKKFLDSDFQKLQKEHQQNEKKRNIIMK